MRFIPDGVDIPDELLWAQDEGRVVFFCGAGVSKSKANLPDFFELTKQVLDGIGASPDDEARKLLLASQEIKEAYDISDVITFDLIFQKLKLNFPDIAINEKIAECLKTTADTDLSAHKTLIDLSTLPTGETRLITTNFDRLFEQCNSKLQSVTRSNLPHIAFNEANWGIVHLHGCVNKKYTGPTEDGFILSSAEFGDAYLAMGWARDFVKEVLKRYVAVFVGYSANDPPIRYLLEGLQESSGLENRAYAFQSCPNDKALASWYEKGVEALPYQTKTGDGHRCLWETLDKWALRSKNPSKWIRSVLSLAKKGPRKLQSHQRGMVAHIISSTNGAREFAQHRPIPPAEWLCVFDPEIRYGEPRSMNGPYESGDIIDPFNLYSLDSDPLPQQNSEVSSHGTRVPSDAWSGLKVNPYDMELLTLDHASALRGYYSNNLPRLSQRLGYLADWIVGVAYQPAAVWWAGRQYSIYPEILDRLRLDGDEFSSTKARRIIRDAWKSILEYHNTRILNPDKVFLLELEQQGNAKEPLAREYAKYFSPTLKLDTYWSSAVPPDANRKFNRKNLVRYDVEYSKDILSINVPDEWLSSIIPKIRYCLELAEDLEKRYSVFQEISSIIPEEVDEDKSESFERSYKLSGHVLHFANLFERLSLIDAELALRELRSWPTNSYVFERLRIWALGNLNIATSNDFVEAVSDLSKDSFWSLRGTRDLLLGLAKCFNDVDNSSKKAIERKIRSGPPKYAWKSKEEYYTHSAHSQLSRLYWLKNHGCQFTFDFEKISKTLRSKAPEWKPQYAEYAASSYDGKVGTVRIDTDTSIIEHLSANEIIPHLLTLKNNKFKNFVEYDPFLGLCGKQPQKALDALKAFNESGGFKSTYWHSFLRKDIRKNDSIEFIADIVHALTSLTGENFSLIALEVSGWFKCAGPLLFSEKKDIFESLWKKFIEVLRDHEGASKSALLRQKDSVDWVNEAINSPAGNLSELIIKITQKQDLGHGEKIPRYWLRHLDELLQLPGDSRHYAYVIICFYLRWFYIVDPEWTEANVIELIEDSDNDQLDAAAIWAGFLWNPHIPQAELYQLLKPHLMKLAISPVLNMDQHAEILAGILLAGWKSRDDESNKYISNSEMRVILVECDNYFRNHILWTLARRSNDSDESADLIVEFLEDVWPKQKSVRTPKISAQLTEIALSQKSNFPRIVSIVSKLVIRFGDDRILIRELYRDKNAIAGEFPEAMLELLYAILPLNKNHWPYGADQALKTIVLKKPALRNDPRYIELEGR